MAWLACPKSGCCILPGKKPPEAAYPGAHGFFVRQNPGWPAWHGFVAETTLSQNIVLVLIGLHMAPNGVLTGSLSRKFRGGSPDRHQIQPSCQKWIEIFRDLGRVGSGFCWRREAEGRAKEAEGRLIEGRCPGRPVAPRASARRRPKADLAGRPRAPTACPDLALLRFFLFGLFGPWALYLAYGLGPPRYFLS